MVEVMDPICMKLKASLKQQYTRIQVGDTLKLRLKALGFSLFRINKSSASPGWLTLLEEKFNTLTTNFAHSSITEIMENVRIAEDAVISHMTASLGIPAHAFESLLRSARGSTNQSLDIVFPKFLALNILSQIGTNLNNIAFLDLKDRIKAIFLALKMPYNLFVKQVAKKCVGDVQLADAACSVDTARLEVFFQLFFGSSKNYKFYVKTAEIYTNVICPKYAENCKELEISAKCLTLTATSHRRAYTGPNQTIILGQSLNLTTLGAPEKQSYRADGLILFGKHPDCDIVFPPDDEEIDYLNFIIFFVDGEYYGIDCSSNKFYSALRLDPNVQHLIKQDQLISIAKFILFQVKNIKHEQRTNIHGNSTVTHEYDDEEMQMDSVLTLSCLEGPFAGNDFNLNTRTREPNVQKIEHMMGCGGGGEAPDIYVPREFGPSRKHITFSLQNNSWHMKDHASTNGSYLLLKNTQEYTKSANLKKNNGIHSQKKQLFSTYSGHSGIVLMIGHYTFLLNLV